MMSKRTKSATPRRDYELVSRSYWGLADPTRVEIMDLLVADGESSVTDMTARLAGGLAQPTVSHHLRALRSAGLVTTRKEASWVFYSATELGRRLLSLAVQ